MISTKIDDVSMVSIDMYAIEYIKKILSTAGFSVWRPNTGFWYETVVYLIISMSFRVKFNALLYAKVHIIEWWSYCTTGQALGLFH